MNRPESTKHMKRTVRIPGHPFDIRVGFRATRHHYWQNIYRDVGSRVGAQPNPNRIPTHRLLSSSFFVVHI